MRLDKIIIVTHTYATGPAQKLEEFLKDRTETLVFLGHPFKFSSSLKACGRLHKKGALSHTYAISGRGLPQILLYLKDVFTTFYIVFRLKIRFDVYIGVNCLNAFSGILLKQLGFTRKVIFYTIDYLPIRFNNIFLNRLYHGLDRIGVERCDFIWNLSSRMAEERRKKGVFPKESHRQITVPIGTDAAGLAGRPLEEKERKPLVFLGHLRRGQGLGLIIEAMEDLSKKVPGLTLKIIGAGPLEVFLKKMVNDKGLNGVITFLGFIEDHWQIEEVLSRGAIGLALYEPMVNSPARYTEPMKPKVYLSCGLPVIITSVPAIAQEIYQRKAGLIVDYKREDLVKAILTLLADGDLYQEYRRNAGQLASEYRWENIFRQALIKSNV